jgi:hypothetical protein
MLITEIVKEEGDVVIRESGGDPESQEARSDNPPAVEAFFHDEEDSGGIRSNPRLYHSVRR